MTPQKQSYEKVKEPDLDQIEDTLQNYEVAKITGTTDQTPLTTERKVQIKKVNRTKKVVIKHANGQKYIRSKMAV